MGFGHAHKKREVPAVKLADLKHTFMVAFNVDWAFVWNDKGSGKDKSFSLWIPVAPEGYCKISYAF